MADPQKSQGKDEWQDVQGGDWEDVPSSTATQKTPPAKPATTQPSIDDRITSALAPNPANYRSLLRTNLIEVPKTLGREVYSGVKTMGSMVDPRTYYHALADRPEMEEVALNPQQRFANRMLIKPVMNAVEDYAGGRVSPEAALSVAPEAMGTGAGTVLGAKAMEMAAPRVTGALSQMRPGSLALKTSTPLRMLQTGEQALSNFDVTRPLKSMSDIPKYWEQTSRGGRLLADTKQAIGEGRASRIPTRLSAEQQAPPPEPQAAALGRPVQSGTPDAALGRIPAMRDPYATVPTLRAKLTAVPRESWEMGEMPATSLPQSEVLGRLGTPAGEKLAMRQFMSENPSALGRIAGGGGGSAKASGAAGSMAEDVIKGNLPRGFGRLVLTPEETLQAEQMMRIAERSARRRGMQFAGGQVPAEGRSVPVRPRPNPTEEWRSKKE